MAKSSLDPLMRHIRKLAAAHYGKDQTDRDLLRALSTRGDQDAFDALVRRHGPLVLAVCRRVLHQLQDAEDAFQATFIMLARQSASFLKKDSLGGWLHRVAYRMALNARKAAERRQRHERQSTPMNSTTPEWEASWREVQLLL